MIILKYFSYLFVSICVCGELHSTHSSDGASRARVERGVEYIRGQDAIRAALFKDNRRNVNILNHTQNIYTLLKDPEKVSVIHGAEPNEKEIIFKAIMASAIIHAPEAKPAYPLAYGRTVDTVIPTDLSELPAGIGFPDWMEFCNPNKKDDNYTPPQGTLNAYDYNQLIKHFDILRVTTTFSEAIARNIKYDIAIKSGYFNFFHEMLENSGVNYKDFFRWFQEVYRDIYAGDLSTVKNQLAGIQFEYVDNKRMEKSIIISSDLIIRHGVSQGQEYNGIFKGINFNFKVQKVKGDGTCGYYALGITRDDLKKYLISVLGESDKKEKISNILNDYSGRKLNIFDDNKKYIKRINVYLNSSYLSMEEIELASSSSDIFSMGSCPNINEEDKKKIWNQKPLNIQIIGVWTYSRPGQLRLTSFYYNGGRVEVDINNNIRSNTTGLANGNFVELLKEKLRKSECVHIYNNGVHGPGAHYDHLAMKSFDVTP